MALLTWNSQLREASFAARKINGRMMFVVTSHHVPDAAELDATVAAVEALAQSGRSRGSQDLGRRGSPLGRQQFQQTAVSPGHLA